MTSCPPIVNDTQHITYGWSPPEDVAVCQALLAAPECRHDFWQEHGTATLHMCITYEAACSVPGGEFSSERFAHNRTMIVVMYGIALHAVCLFGLIGNALTLVVLRRREFARSSSTVYLTAMLVADSIYLAVNYVQRVLITALDAAPWSISPLPAISRIYGDYVLSDWARNACTLLTVAVTVERYIYIRHSMHANKFCTRRRARIASAVLLLLVSLYEAPRALVQRVVAVPLSGASHSFHTNITANETLLPSNASDSSSPSSATLPASSCRIQSPLYQIVVDNTYVSHDEEEASLYFGQVAFMLTPLVALTVMTALLLSTIGRSNRRRRRLSTAAPPRSVDINLNAVLLSVVIAFIVCSTPMAIVSLLRRHTALDEFFGKARAGVLLYYIAVLALNLNAAINAPLFCAFGTKFRAHFKAIFFCRTPATSDGGAAVSSGGVSVSTGGGGLGGKYGFHTLTTYTRVASPSSCSAAPV